MHDAEIDGPSTDVDDERVIQKIHSRMRSQKGSVIHTMRPVHIFRDRLPYGPA